MAAVNVICRNLNDDRVIPRFSRYLRDALGWTLTALPAPGAELIYLSGYFEETQLRPGWPNVPVAAYFTHYETEPANNAKAALFDRMAKRVDLRIATAPMYADYLSKSGPTVLIPPPVERDKFTIAQRPERLTAGFSGYTYANRRKGEDLARQIITNPIAKTTQWRASGRGWPVATTRYDWADMATFYQSLDILIITALVEGVPMPPLEALSCGVSVVIPRGVGLLDTLPDIDGIHRYEAGSTKDAIKALGQAIEARPTVDRQALRATTEPYTIEAWCEGHAAAMQQLEPMAQPTKITKRATPKAVTTRTNTRGIYCVAFGEQARQCAENLMHSARHHMPDIPIALCAETPIGLEDIFIKHPDADVGGRRAKLKAYELTPPEWTEVLYLDADTEITADISFYFDLISDGWEFVICKDPHLMDTMQSFKRANNSAEYDYTADKIHTMNTLQFNGGVWAFGRNERVAAFFQRWQAEWERYAQRDQGALIRAMYGDPLKIYVLGNEWNTFEKYSRGIVTAGLMHYPGKARRWKGYLPGRIDSPAAWAVVERQKGGRVR
jgi:hypothetical protein